MSQYHTFALTPLHNDLPDNIDPNADVVLNRTYWSSPDVDVRESAPHLTQTKKTSKIHINGTVSQPLELVQSNQMVNKILFASFRFYRLGNWACLLLTVCQFKCIFAKLCIDLGAVL